MFLIDLIFHLVSLCSPTSCLHFLHRTPPSFESSMVNAVRANNSGIRNTHLEAIVLLVEEEEEDSETVAAAAAPPLLRVLVGLLETISVPAVELTRANDAAMAVLDADPLFFLRG